jgi:hypothetical protein
VYDFAQGRGDMRARGVQVQRHQPKFRRARIDVGGFRQGDLFLGGDGRE